MNLKAFCALILVSRVVAQPVPFSAGLPDGTDLFSKQTRTRITEGVRRACKAGPNSWIDGPKWSRELVNATRRLSSEQPGKQIYLDFLKSTYGYNISALNAAYGVEAGAFTDLEGGLLTTADLSRVAIVKDDAEFLPALAQEFFTVTIAALRQCDKQAKIYSEIFDTAKTPVAVLEAAARLVQVVRIRNGNGEEWEKRLKVKVEITGGGDSAREQ